MYLRRTWPVVVVSTLIASVLLGSAPASADPGSATSWGTGDIGELGDGNAWRESPAAVAVGTAASVSAGRDHSCAVSAGSVYCWGSNLSGQLGNGSRADSAVPVAVSVSGALAGKPVTSVAAGDTHTCALADGRVFCWGSNGYGELGNGSRADSPVPVAVSVSGALAGKLVTSVTAGDSHTCALADGRAYCWGSNQSGRLGNGTEVDSAVPQAVATGGLIAGQTVTWISAGSAHTCAVAAGKAHCWGFNGSGRLGDGQTDSSPVPQPVSTAGVMAGRAVTSVSAGGEHSCAVAGGEIFCWGDNEYRQLGREGEGSTEPVAMDYSGLGLKAPFANLTAGEAHNCATSAGRAFCWGRGDAGAMGRPLQYLTGEPVQVDTSGALGNRQVTQVDAGGSHACAVAAGSVLCWGSNGSGRLGIGTSSSSSVPVAVEAGWFGGKLVDSVAGGGGHACAVAGGIGFCWGYNKYGQAGDGRDLNFPLPTPYPKQIAGGQLGGAPITSIAAGGTHSCAVASGRAFCWGDNRSGQIGNGSKVDSGSPVGVASGAIGGRTVTAISAGAAHTCAVAGGRAFCWGDNAFGQLGDGGTATAMVPVAVGGSLAGRSVTAISAGDGFTCAVADGGVFCWGDNGFGQLGDGSGRSSRLPRPVGGALAGRSATQVSTGTSHACAVADGRAYCWGNGAFGRLGNGATSDSSAPVAVTTAGPLGTSAVTRVSAGSTHTCAVAAGRAFCWGDNRGGQLGIGSTASTAVPARVDSGALTGSVVSDVSAGQGFTLAVGRAAQATAPPVTTPPPATTPPSAQTPKKVKRPGRIKITKKKVKRGKVRLKWKKAKRAKRYQVRITRPGKKFTKKYKKWTKQKKRVYVRKVKKGKKYRIQIRGLGPGGRGPIKTVKIRGR